MGPTKLGVRCLIHQHPSGTGQDILNTSTTPFQITGGSNNPNPGLVGQTIAGSDSIITIALYDGHDLCPGSSCGFSITIVGFLQAFIHNVDPGAQGTVNATIINVAGCGGGGGGGGGAVITTGGSLFPVRLVQPTN